MASRGLDAELVPSNYGAELLHLFCPPVTYQEDSNILASSKHCAVFCILGKQEEINDAQVNIMLQ